MMKSENTFKRQFLNDVLRLAHSFEKNNWDEMRFASARHTENTFDPAGGASALELILERVDEFEKTLHLFADQQSRALFYQLLLFRVLGHLHVRLPLSTPDYWQKVRSLNAFVQERNAGMIGEFPLHHYRLAQPPIECLAHPYNIFNAFVIEQYLLRRPGIEVAVRPGDIVIDGGACLGETALAFSALCGTQGRVFAFEFVKSALMVAQRNWALNPELSSRIRLMRKALYDRSGILLSFSDAGPGTSVREQGDGEPIETLSIDDLKAAEGIKRIDFIKLDIEGSEASALRGASRTIIEDRPRLAISLYHKLQDFYELPALLHRLNPAYRFAIDHYSIHAEETVLYAWETPTDPGADGTKMTLPSHYFTDKEKRVNRNGTTHTDVNRTIREGENKQFPSYFNMDKKEIIDYAFTRCNVRPESFADLGGVWGVDGAYTFYPLEQYEVKSAYLVDTNSTDEVTRRAGGHPQLRVIIGNFGDFDLVNRSMPPVDAVFFFDVLLHQVKPDWDEVLAFYASRSRLLVIFNQQFTRGNKTVRLLDLGKEGYFENVPHERNHPLYVQLFEKMYEQHPQHNRIWRDIHNVWQWGITDDDLLCAVDKLGFSLRYYKNCGKFGTLNNFENHAFVFEKRFNAPLEQQR